MYSSAVHFLAHRFQSQVVNVTQIFLRCLYSALFLDALLTLLSHKL